MSPNGILGIKFSSRVLETQFFALNSFKIVYASIKFSFFLVAELVPGPRPGQGRREADTGGSQDRRVDPSTGEPLATFYFWSISSF
jgi:hypothetical protein